MAASRRRRQRHPQPYGCSRSGGGDGDAGTGHDCHCDAAVAALVKRSTAAGSHHPRQLGTSQRPTWLGRIAALFTLCVGGIVFFTASAPQCRTPCDAGPDKATPANRTATTAVMFTSIVLIEVIRTGLSRQPANRPATDCPHTHPTKIAIDRPNIVVGGE
jgi:hypothetical protein